MAANDKSSAALEALRLGECSTYQDAATKLGIDRTGLSRRHRGVRGTRAQKEENGRNLNNAQEAELIRYIDGLCSRGLPPTRQMIRNFASEIAKKIVGKSWVERFLDRHHSELLILYTTGLDRTCKQADPAYKYTLYFELLRRKMEEYNVDARHVYNMDEKGFLIGILPKSKRIFSRPRWESKESLTLLQDGNRERITVLACICADGTALTPGLIYQAASGDIQDTWLQDFEPDKHQAFFTSSPTGWTSNDIGFAWLEQVFNRETKAKARSARRLLILDGYGSYVTMKFINFCDANKILLAMLPPHATHTLQPLDVGMFNPLAAAYSAALSSHIDRSQGICAITKREFFTLFSSAWSSSFTEKNVLAAFEANGIKPLNPQVILQRFASKVDSRPSSSGSSGSVLSASDWQKIKRLLREVVAGTYTDEKKMLSRTIHTLEVQTSLLQHENEQLKEALLYEKKRRQRSKALLLQPPDEYNGGAVSYSPQEVQQARDRQHQEELDEAAVQHQKSEAMKLRDKQKLPKQLELEEKRHIWLMAQQEREREKAAKATARGEERRAKQAEKQLQTDIQTSQRRQRSSIKPQSKPAIDIVAPVDEGAPVMPSAALTVNTRRGRKVKLPTKFM